MGLFLQIIGGIVVGFLILILLLVLAWKLFKRRLMRQLASMAGDLQYAYIPARLNLQLAKQIQWQDEKKVQALARELTDLGFADAGAFRVEELDYLRIRGLAHEGQSIYAAIYEHDKAGVWLDVYSLYLDGTGATHTNASEGEHLDKRPGHLRVHDRTSTLAELVRRHVAERPPRGLRPATTLEFQRIFEQTYADGMDWRNARGGITEAEILRMAAAEGKELSPDELQQLREMQINQAIVGLDDTLGKNFLQTTTLTAAEWEECEDRLVYVYDLLPPDQVADRFYTAVYPNREDEATLPPELAGLSAREAFARLNEGLPPELRMELAGRLTKPVDADVYVGPIIVDDDE